MKHLDSHALSALTARDPEAVAWFREHLASPCDTCEEFLAQSGPDALDGQVDALLLGLAPRPAASQDELGWMRLRKRLRTSAHTGRWVGAAAALAACLLAVVLVPRLVSPSEKAQPWNGVKGSSRISLELAAVARGADGQLRRLDQGDPVLSEEVLLLRYHATEAGSALLFQQLDDKEPELLGSFQLEAGTHDLSGPQGLAGVSLLDVEGPVTVWLVGAAPGEELSPDEVQGTLKAIRGGGESPLSIARFDVLVQNGQNRR